MNIPDRRHGFTLIELSVVLIVIALITGMGLVAAMGTLESVRRAATENKLNEIERALMEFRNRHNRLPCPGGITLTSTWEVYGLEAANPGRCLGGSPTAIDISANGGQLSVETGNPALVQGGVPARTLGLPDEFMFDGWGRRFLYAVNANATASNAFDFITVAANSCGIRVLNAAGGYRSGSDTVVTSGAIYALVSHGSNGHGAYVSGGTRISSGSTNADELQNCNCTATGADGTANATFVQKEITENPSDPTDSFDDIVRFKERWQLQNAADYANARGHRRCQMAVGVWDGSFGDPDLEAVTCYRRGCDSWVPSQPSFLGTSSAAVKIAGLFFPPDNSYLHATFIRPPAPGCSTVPIFGVCQAAMFPLGVEGTSPLSDTPLYCSYSCQDAHWYPPVAYVTNNHYVGFINMSDNSITVPLQLFRLTDDPGFKQLLTATAITPPITSYATSLSGFGFSRNAEYFFATYNDWNWGEASVFRIYKQYEFGRFKELHSSKYPVDLPIGDDILAGALSPDGQFLATLSTDEHFSEPYRLLVWRIGAGNPFVSGGDNPFGAGPIAEISYDYYAFSVAFSPDGRYLAVGLAAEDFIATDNIINHSIKIYKIDGDTFTPVTIVADDPNIFYNGVSNTPEKMVFTADSKSLIISTWSQNTGIVTLDRVNATTFEQRVPSITPGGGWYNTSIAVLH